MSQMQELASSAYFRSLVERGTPLIEIKREYSATTSAGTVARAYHIVKAQPKENGGLLDGLVEYFKPTNDPDGEPTAYDSRMDEEDAEFRPLTSEAVLMPLIPILPQALDMTRREAEAAIVEFKGIWKQSRIKLLEMFERGAHRACGFENFTEFANERLELHISEPALEKHRAAARVERNLLTEINYFQRHNYYGSSESSDSLPLELPLDAALELNRIKDPQGQREAYAEYREVFKHPHTPRQVATSLKHIVNRRLMENKQLTVPEEKAKALPVESAAVKEIVLHFLEAAWEDGKWLRVDVRLPDGNLAIVRVPKGAIP